SDDAADFDWIAIEAGSPLRAQVETSGRRVLDLTAPAPLPAVEPLPSSARTAAPAPRATPRVPESPVFSKPKAIDPFGAYRPPRVSSRKPLIIAVGAMALLLLGAVLLFPWYRGRQEEERQRAEIVNVLRSTALFDTAKTREQFANELARLRASDLPRARDFAEAAARLSLVMEKADFDALRHTPVGPHLQAKAQAAHLNLPTEVGATALALDDAAKQDRWLRDLAPRTAGDAGYDELSRRKSESDGLGAGLGPE